MDILVPWLAATIEGELGEALRHWENDATRGQSTGKFRRLSYDDGSNLRIRSAKRGPVVQITKFLNYEDLPIQVTLSDTVIRINASITNQASQRYAEKNRKQVTDGTLGGLIQLLDFEIVATHLGPRNKRLTLYVEDFKRLDAVASGTFGVAPQAIEDTKGAKELLNKLADLRRGKLDAHFEQSGASSPIRSQPSTQTSEQGNDQDSQSGFATQLTRSIAPINTKPKPPESTTSINFNSTSSTENFQPMAPPTKVKHKIPLASTVDPPQAQRVPQKPKSSSKEALLNLLQKSKRAPLAPETITEPNIKGPPQSVTVSSKSAVRETDDEGSQTITVASSIDPSSRAPVNGQKRKRGSHDNVPQKKADGDHIFFEVEQDRENLAINLDRENKASSGVPRIEASDDTLSSQPATSSASRVDKPHPNGSLERSVPSNLKPGPLTTAQTTGLNRISRRDVKISKDQEALLSRADSWLPAEPGQREPTANIPISILKKLNRKASLRAQRSAQIPKQRSSTMTPSAVTDSSVNSDTDDPVSSGQWPASPERDQLPPDSSLEYPEHSDHLFESLSNIPRSVSSAPKQSHTSISSQPILKHGGSAISTTPSPSHSLDLDLRPSGSEHDELGRNITDGGAGNKSSSVEVSVPPAFSIEQGPTSLRNEENIKYSTMESSHGKDLPPVVSPAPIQPATHSADVYAAQKTLSPLLPASPTSDSDLEMTVPLALNEKVGSIASSAPMQRFPSTASQPQEPFTQVKWTPYANSRIQNESLLDSMTSSPLLESNCFPIANGATNDDTEFVPASIIHGLETPAAEANGGKGSPHIIEDYGLVKVAATSVEDSNREDSNREDSNSGLPTNKIVENPEKLATDVGLGTSRAGPAAIEQEDSSLVIIKDRCVSSSWKQPAVVAEASIPTPAVSEKLSKINDIQTDPPLQLPVFEHAAQSTHETKRKVAESGFVSPTVAKRQKMFKTPSSFQLVEKYEIPRDPSEGARQYRQDFLASRRSSESSTPTMSPTMPFTVFSGTMPESPRDPSERARQFRQEFLASRRSSVTSTPTTSPGRHFLALKGEIKADRRSVEVEKSVEQVTVQNPLLDIETQHHRMSELGMSSTISQRGDPGSDAAPLSNGTTELEENSDGARLAAQNNLPSNNKADSPLFVAQDTQSVPTEGLDAEQSTVVETSSYGSDSVKQRPQSDKFDVSFRPIDYCEAEDGVPNAKGGADTIADSRVDVEVESCDQDTKNFEENSPRKSEVNAARKSLLTQVDGLDKQKGDVPTLKLNMDHVLEPSIAAARPVSQGGSIEVGLDAQMHDRTLEEPTSPQQTEKMSTKTSTLDEIAAEPSSRQQLDGQIKNTTMPSVQLSEGITSDAHLDMSTERSTFPPPVVSAFVVESDTEIQPRALSSAVSSSNALSDSEREPVRQHQRSGQSPLEIIEQKSPSVPQNIFEKFKATYPSYPGDKKHFAGVCRKINILVKANRMEHQSLWDDFIIRHKVEYSQYLQRCAEEADDAVPFETFYQTHIERPKHEMQIINRRTLEEALALVAEQPSSKLVVREGVKDDERCLAPSDQRSTSDSSSVVEKRERKGTKSVHKPVISKRPSRKLSSSPVLIDLTQDDPLDNAPSRTKQTEIPDLPIPQSSVNSVPVEPPQLRSHRDSSTRLQEFQTFPTKQGSHAASPPQPMRVPLSTVIGPTRRTSTNPRLSFAWEDSARKFFETLPEGVPSDSLKRLPEPGLRGTRATESSKTDESRIQASAKSPLLGPKQNRGLLNTCHRVIHSNWEIKVNELLEPEYSHGQLWSESMIELLAEIASKVPIHEARDRIKHAINLRIKSNARSGRIDQDRKILKSDLEVVRGIVETSSMSTSRPLSPRRTNAGVEKQNEGTPVEWWDDYDSPYKRFSRAYASIRPGKGNSFAKGGPAKPGATQTVEQATSSGVQLKKINMMRWEL